MAEGSGPERFGRYVLEAELGRGGMGVVFRAYDTGHDRMVALKRLHRHLAQDETFQARFRRESRMAARLNDPHIVPIHDFGEIDGQLYLDMRLVEGPDLADLVKRGPAGFPVADAVEIVGQVAGALDAAHRAGLVHRDVKPSNVLVTGVQGHGPDDLARAFAYLVDFGIARATMGDDGSTLTTTTGTVGTLAYMSPERISGRPGDARSDVYSLACVLFECVTGIVPYRGETFDVMSAHVHAAPPSAAATSGRVPPVLDAVIRRGMAKNADDRFATANEFGTAARRALTAPLHYPGPGYAPAPGYAPPPPSRRTPPPQPHLATPPPHPPAHPPPRAPQRGRRIVWVAAAGVVVLVAGALTFLLTRGNSDDDAGGPTPPNRTSATAPSPDFPSRDVPTSWRPYSAFSKLVGPRPGDTRATFRNGTCAVVEYDPDEVGADDQVNCTKLGGSSPVTVTVLHFGTAGIATGYLDRLTNDNGYAKQYWTLAGQRRGLLVTSPATSKAVTVLSSICQLPTYLVRFSAPATAALTEAGVQRDYWAAAQFPDTTPKPC